MPLILEIQGLDELKGNVTRAGQEMKDQLRWAMVQSTNAVKNSAQKYAPYKTGTLRRSIQTSVSSPYEGIVYQDGSIAKYGRAQEYGTVGMTINSHSRLGRAFSYIGNIPPHPYMLPGLQDNIDTIKEYFATALGKVVAVMAGHA